MIEIDRYDAMLVADGAAHMDAQVPGWERHVDVSKIDMASGCQCVLGQVGQVIMEKQRAVWLSDHCMQMPDGEISTPWSWMKTHFDFDIVGAFSSTSVHDAWVALIKERFDSGILSDANYD
jgi:hypothetical protein